MAFSFAIPSRLWRRRRQVGTPRQIRLGAREKSFLSFRPLHLSLFFSLDFARSSCFSAHSLCLPGGRWPMRASPTVVVWPQERTRERTRQQGRRVDGWMDGWEEGGKFSLPPSLLAALRSLSFLERQSIIGDVDQYSRSAPSSIGRLRLMHNPNLLQWQRGRRGKPMSHSGEEPDGVSQGYTGSVLLHGQIRTSPFAFGSKFLYF